MPIFPINYYRLLFVFSFLFVNVVQSQTFSISGKIVDTQNAPIELATVVLLHPKDSTMINYTVSDNKGLFEIVDSSNDTFILQIHSSGYIPFFKTLINKKNPIDLKTITLIEETNELEAIVISAVIPVQIKNDTIAFNASSFKVNYDDNIEKLLSKLPGLEIDSDGKIVAQGNEVTKIFVDGKEFFGGDPSIVLKNLSADAIAKVEIVDKKSDESELTGIDDGEKEVVINFSLKKSKKSSGFGKLSAGMGSDNRYFTNLNYNRFSPKTQLSVIGKFNNINVTGSNIQGFLKNADGIGDESDDTEATIKKPKSLSGYLETGVAGINIGKEFRKKESFNADYFFNSSENEGKSHSKRINFSNNNDFDFESDNDFKNTSKNHNLNFNYKNQSNSKHSLFVNGRIKSDQTEAYQNRDGSYFDENNVLVTSKLEDFQNENQRTSGDINLNYYHKLPKKGRSFNSKLKLSAYDFERDNEQHSFITRNLDTNNPNTREIFTLRDENFNNSTVNLNFRYTEPLGGNHYLKVEPSFLIKYDKENTSQQKTTINTSTIQEDIAYRYNHKENNFKTKAAYSYNTKKLNIFTGLEFQDVTRTFGEVDLENFAINKFYYNPFANLRYNPKKGRKFKFNYRRLIRNPRPMQSTTVINDLNPYFIRIGNPELNAEKIDAINLDGTIHNFKSSLSFYGKLNYQYTKDAIIQTIDIDEEYIKTRSYQNSGYRNRFNAVLSFTQKISGLGLRYSLKSNFLYTTSNSIVNLQLNDVTARNYMLGLTFENYNKNVFDFKIGGSFTSNKTSFSIEQDLNRKYTQQQYFTMFDVDITKQLNFNTQLDYLIFTDDQFTPYESFSLWNAALSYSLNKKSNSIIKLVFIDLLDNNKDIYRRSTSNYFEETTSESLGRYVILSFTHKLNNNSKKKNKP